MRGGARDRPLRGLDADRRLDDPATRQAYVTTLFDLIAPRYDAFTHSFSFGMDRGWKREVAGLAAAAVARASDGETVVADLACGTGDLAFAIAGRGRTVAGIDVSEEMLSRAKWRRQAVGSAPPCFAGGDMGALPLRSASVDLITIGYGLRNASHLDAALDEIARVLRPGATLVTLDFYKPPNAIWRRLFLGYLTVAGNLIGWAWHREPAAYGYIPRSITRFLVAGEFTAELTRRGFDVYYVGTHLWGGICVHAGRLRGRGRGSRVETGV
jgi:demethylmenaquinone methyltransferase/2-methoxy-6-polyprenyl-1,4-benzoquinol methylase